MGRYIVKLGEFYLEWSTITDSPVTFGMMEKEFREYYKAEYGRAGLRGLDTRLTRTKAYGTSSWDPKMTASRLFRGNRAGPDGGELTKDEVYRAYCRHESIRDGWVVPIAGGSSA